MQLPEDRGAWGRREMMVKGFAGQRETVDKFSDMRSKFQ